MTPTSSKPKIAASLLLLVLLGTGLSSADPVDDLLPVAPCPPLLETEPVSVCTAQPPTLPDVVLPECGLQATPVADILGPVDVRVADAACVHGHDHRPMAHDDVACHAYSDPPGALYHGADPCVHLPADTRPEPCMAPSPGSPSVSSVQAANCDHGTDSRFPPHADTYCPAYVDAPGATVHLGGDPCQHAMDTAATCIDPVDVNCDHGPDSRPQPHGVVPCPVYQNVPQNSQTPNIHDPGDPCRHLVANDVCSPSVTANCRHVTDPRAPGHDEIYCYTYVDPAPPGDNYHPNPAVPCVHAVAPPTQACSPSVTANCRHVADSRDPGHGEVICPVYVDPAPAATNVHPNPAVPCVHGPPHDCAAPADAACTHHFDNRPPAHGDEVCPVFADPAGSTRHLGSSCIHAPALQTSLPSCTLTGSTSQSVTCGLDCSISRQFLFVKWQESLYWQVKVLTVGPPTSSVRGIVTCEDNTSSPITECTATVQTGVLAQCTSGVVDTKRKGKIVCKAEVDGSKPAPYHYAVLCLEPRDPREEASHLV